MPARLPTTRSTDPEHITIDRKIPLWGVLGVAGAFLGQAILMWNGQNMQAQEMRHQSEQITELATQVKGMAAQMATKDGVDIEQNLKINEISRRVLLLEGAKER